MHHKTIQPAIMYFGTPVVLISTCNEDGSVNIAPNSSIWWLGWSAMLGLDGTSKTTENLIRTGECVLNLASDGMVEAVNSVAKLTGSSPVPMHKQFLGYEHCADKLARSGLSTVAADTVSPPRIAQCQVHLEAKLRQRHAFARGGVDDIGVPLCAFELAITCTHVDEALLMPTDQDRIDPDKWHPLIMSFRQFYTTHGRLGTSRLAKGSEALYAPWRGSLLKRGISKVLFGLANRQHHASD
jgi:flavin reductase (DIM6/NTAB) family NADH-FMN oxidoreductase RutF